MSHSVANAYIEISHLKYSKERVFHGRASKFTLNQNYVITYFKLFFQSNYIPSLQKFKRWKDSK